MTQPNRGKRSGVLLVGHGTRDEVGTRQFLELGVRLSRRLSPQPVVASLLEFQQPTIPEGWSDLVAQGVDHIHLAPLLLFAAGHAKSDIPDLAIQCQTQTPKVSFDQSRPLSRHPAIVELALQRLHESMRTVRASSQRTAVVMIGRGSRDPCASADMRVLSEVIRHRLDVGAVETAFYAMASPEVPSTLRQIAGSGRFDEIVVQPHLLFAGRLYQAILQQVDQARSVFPAITFTVSNYLGPDDLVAQAIASRIAE